MSGVGRTRGVITLAALAPVGLALEVGRRTHERITIARAVGEMAVKVCAAEVRVRLAADAAPPAAAPIADDIEPHEPLGVEDTAAVITDLADDLADDLPIAGYESLAASQVVAMLPTVATSDLDVIERFEQQHRRRRTVLGKIAQLQRV